MTVHRLGLALFITLVMALSAAPAMAHGDDGKASAAVAAPAAGVAQTETTPGEEPPAEEPPAEEPTDTVEDDPNEEEFGEEVEEVEPPAEEPAPAQEEAPPAPVAAPAQELPRTGTDQRILLAAGSLLLLGLAMRRVARSA